MNKMEFAKWLLDNRYQLRRIDKEGSKYGRNLNEYYTLEELLLKFEQEKNGWK